MPPAFNLSQDQTLQFNLCKLSSKLTWKNQFHVSIRVFLFAKLRVAYATQRRPPTPNAHTYRLLIFKEQAFNELCILAQSLHTLISQADATLGNKVVYAYSNDNRVTIHNQATLTATGSENYGIYSAGTVTNDGNMNFQTGIGNKIGRAHV